jgi:glycosyltransferase involved in cell wall biosynthesis
MPDLPKLTPIAADALSVVLLAHNAGAHIDPVLQSWVRFLDTLPNTWEIIIADDGSTDDTAVRAATLAEQESRLRLVQHAPARGEGAALRDALPLVRHPLLFYTLLDPRFEPAELGTLLHKKHQPEKPDLEIDAVHILNGFRAGRPMPILLRIPGMLWQAISWLLFSYVPPKLPGWLGWRARLGWLLGRVVFGVRLHDLGCPFRLLRREIFARIPLQSDGPFVHVEILAKANFLGHILGEEVPIRHHPPVNEPRIGGSFRQRGREFWHVLKYPDFGPAVLDAPKETAPSPPQAESPDPASLPEAGPGADPSSAHL